MKETRTASVETRDDGMILVGIPVVFDTKTLIHDPQGDYYEVITSGALDHADISDSTLTVEHDSRRIPLARCPRTLELEVRRDGLHMRAELADTETAREVYEAVRRGDLSSMSFAFTVASGGSSYDPRTNTRTISAIDKLLECSLVAHPAYEATTVSVEARSQMREAREREERRRQALSLCNSIIIGSRKER